MMTLRSLAILALSLSVTAQSQTLAQIASPDVDRAGLLTWYRFWFSDDACRDETKVSTIQVVSLSTSRTVLILPEFGVRFDTMRRTNGRPITTVTRDTPVSSAAAALNRFFQSETLLLRLDRTADRFSTQGRTVEFITSPAMTSSISEAVENVPRICTRQPELSNTVRSVSILAAIGEYASVKQLSCGTARYLVPSFSDIDPEIYAIAEYPEHTCTSGIVRFYERADGSWLHDKVISPRLHEWSDTVFKKVKQVTMSTIIVERLSTR
jgi:hypothetical protein